MIVVNDIDIKMILLMTFILMEGGFLYNLWASLPYIKDGTFNLITLVKQNYQRFLYSLVVALTFSFTLNFIPESAEALSELSGTGIMLSAVGLLMGGIGLSRVIFTRTTKVL